MPNLLQQTGKEIIILYDYNILLSSSVSLIWRYAPNLQRAQHYKKNFFNPKIWKNHLGKTTIKGIEGKF